MRLRHSLGFGLALLLLYFGSSCSRGKPAAAADPTLTLPPGFKISTYAADLPNARSMTLSPNGTLFVGTRREGKVYALPDRDKNGQVDRVYTIASGLKQPNGVAFRDGALYVAETTRVQRYDGIEERLDNPPTPVLVRGDFPTEDRHSWKFIAFGPDGKLYVPIGAPCNDCAKQDTRFASITRMNADGSDFEVFANGVRNTVGFDWHPQSGELWFTDNGRDKMGENIPPDELNRAAKAGLHFGFPYCHGTGIADPVLGEKRQCPEFEVPVADLGPHVAALGMRFYTGTMFPPEYRGQIFIAEHGSWNRSKKIGYRVSRVKLEGNRAVEYKTFAEGWLRPDGDVDGRPVDVLVMPDGALLVSDDLAGKIYRISYSTP